MSVMLRAQLLFEEPTSGRQSFLIAPTEGAKRSVQDKPAVPSLHLLWDVCVLGPPAAEQMMGAPPKLDDADMPTALHACSQPVRRPSRGNP